MAEFRQILMDHRQDKRIHSLFAVAETIPASAAKNLFGPVLLDILVKSGFLGASTSEIFSYFHIQIYKEKLFVSDYTLPQGTPYDLVLPVGPSGELLESITLRKNVTSILDLGCGCGLQTIFLALHSQLVTATDINPRCLSLTALNARLNNVHNIELLEGSYFEPVKGRTFDLIVSNTPYVITPNRDQIYRDAKDPGDQTVLNLIQQIPAYLNEGGYAHILATWLHKKAQAFEEPIQKILNGAPVDTFLMHHHSSTPFEYAGDWVYDEIQTNPLLFIWTRFKWTLWYWHMGMERFAFGAITLRRRINSVNWFCTENGTTIIGSKSAGDHINDIFDVQDRLSSIPDSRALLDKVLIPVRLDIQTGVKRIVRLIKIKTGLVFSIKISPFVGQILSNMDGIKSLRQVMAQAIMDGTETPESEANALSSIIHLLKKGYLAFL